MHLYRAAWHRLAPLATRGALLRTAPVRRMSSTSVPGSSGEALPYYLFTGAAFTGGLFYVYRTLSTDQERFRDRHAFIDSQQKEDHSARSSGGRGVEAEASYVTEACEEATESITVEAVAVAVEDVPEEEVISSISVEQEQPVTEEQELVPLAEEEIAASSEAAPLQVEETIELTEDDNDEPSPPVLEEIAERIEEELSSAAEDWSELSARRPEVAEEETSPSTEESSEVAESEKVAASS